MIRIGTYGQKKPEDLYDIYRFTIKFGGGGVYLRYPWFLQFAGLARLNI